MTTQRSVADSAERPAWRRLSLARALWNLLFPPRCVACRARGDWLCPDCVDQILFFEPPWPQILDGLWPLQDVRVAAHLWGPLRQAIHSFKYGGLRALAGILGEILYDCWDTEPWPVDAIVPVPLHPSRLRERGYNQSALLAHELSLRTELPVVEGVLLRITPTRPQVGLDAEERAENVRDAFRCRDESLRGLQILLVDDVLTTGATLRACGHALLQGDAATVRGLALAHD